MRQDHRTAYGCERGYICQTYASGEIFRPLIRRSRPPLHCFSSSCPIPSQRMGDFFTQTTTITSIMGTLPTQAPLFIDEDVFHYPQLLTLHYYNQVPYC